MGLRDTEEQLEAAQAQSVLDERTIADLRARLDAIRALPADVLPNGEAWLDAGAVLEILDRP